jgi:hypothetical protein
LRPIHREHLGMFNERLETVTEVARHLHLTRWQVLARIRAFKIPVVRVGQTFLVRVSDVRNLPPVRRGRPKKVTA